MSAFGCGRSADILRAWQHPSRSCHPLRLASVKPIDAGELLLHVGVHKTGTTALQVALADAREDLVAHDVCYPGSGTYQHTAVLAGAGRTYGWQRDAEVPEGLWEDLVSQARGRSIISSEFLDDVAPEVASRMVEDLGGPQRVRVVITLRAIGAILPSAWQQRVKAGSTTGYGAFLKQVFAAQPGPKAQRFWFRHDQVAQVRRWAEIVGTDRTYVVVIPDGDRTAIFTAFEELLDLPAAFLASRPATTRNRSMTAPEAEFLRRVNKAVADDLSWDDYQRLVRRTLVLTMVEQRTPPDDEPRILTPRWAADAAQARGEEFARGVAASGATVIGDPSALAARPRSGKTPKAKALPMDAAVAGAVALLQRNATPAPSAVSRREALRVALRPGRRRSAT